MSKHSVRDHNLGPKIKFDPMALFNSPEYRETDALIVSLALLFNDLKGLVLFQAAFDEVAPSQEENPTSAKVGQQNGIYIQIIRYKISIFVELLKLLETHQGLLKSAILMQTYEKMDGRSKTDWDQVKFIAIEKEQPESMDQFKRMFIRMRSHGGFHYYQTKPIEEGYLHHFAKSDPRSQGAYLSTGKTMELTRFYFADAAIHGLYEKWIDQMGEAYFFNVIDNYITMAHSSIQTFVINYLKERGISFSLEK